MNSAPTKVLLVIGGVVVLIVVAGIVVYQALTWTPMPTGTLSEIVREAVEEGHEVTKVAEKLVNGVSECTIFLTKKSF